MTTPSTPTASRRAWIMLAVASTGSFLFVLDAGLVSVAFPLIEEDFADVDRATVSWLSIGYFVAGSAAMLPGASLGDRFGRTRLFIIGLVVFALAGAVTAAAPTIEVLISARVVQGIGVGLLTSMSLALVLPEFPETQRGLAIGAWGATGALAAMLAPTAGAVVTESFGWRPGFAVVAPLAGATAIAARRVLPQSASHRLSELDGPGMIGATVVVAGLAAISSLGHRLGWLSGTVLALIAITIVGAAIFRWAARRRPGAVFDENLLQEPAWVIGAAGAGLQQLGFMSMFFSTPLIITNIWGWSLLEAGLGMSLSMAISMVVAPVGGRIADHVGDRLLIITGAVLFSGGLVWWRLFIDVRPSVAHYVAGMTLIGFGGALCGNLTTSAALRRIDEERMAVASSTLSTLRRLAAGIGVAISVALLGEADGPALLAGAHRVWLYVAAVTLAMIPFAARLPATPSTTPAPQE